MTQTLDLFGSRIFAIFAYLAQIAILLFVSVKAALFDRGEGLRAIVRVVSAQIYFTGFQALPLVSALALAAGGILVMQASAQLSLLGSADLVGNLMVIVIIREIGPLLTALLVVARSGTAVASEIGNMRAGREIDALEAMGINPYSYIIFPRVFGGVVSVVCLAFYFDAVAIFGGFAVTRLMHDLPFTFYLSSIAQAISAGDVALVLVKNLFGGLIIFLVACQQGMLVQQSSHEVPQVTTKAVVNSVISVTCFNLVVTVSFYVYQLWHQGVL